MFKKTDKNFLNYLLLMIDGVGGKVGTVEEICSFEHYFCLDGELQ